MTLIDPGDRTPCGASPRAPRGNRTWLTKLPPSRLIVVGRVSYTSDGQSDSAPSAWLVWQRESSLSWRRGSIEFATAEERQGSGCDPVQGCTPRGNYDTRRSAQRDADPMEVSKTERLRERMLALQLAQQQQYVAELEIDLTMPGTIRELARATMHIADSLIDLANELESP